jgi:hypothetical protein
LRNSGIGFAKPGQSPPCAVRIPQFLNPSIPLYKERSSTERCNSLNDAYKLDRSCRNASYGLIRLTLANIVEHAVVRHLEAVKRSSKEKLMAQTLNKIGIIYREQFLDTG